MVRILQAAETSDTLLLNEVYRCISSGGTLIFPTETVYGIGAAAEDDTAIAAIYDAKQRGRDKPLALHVSDTTDALPFVDRLTPAAQRAMEYFWPGPLAIVVPRKSNRFAAASHGLPTISLRCPSDALCQKILERAGPLAATSANRSGSPPFTGTTREYDTLPDAMLAIIAGPTAYQQESTVLDCTSAQPRVLREGAVKADALAAVFGTLASTF